MVKDTPIHVDALDHPDVRRFAEVAGEVCEIFERIDDLSEVEFLSEVKEKLSLAYSLAHRLPDPYDWPDDDEDDTETPDEELESVRPPEGMSEAENNERFWDLYRRIGEKLGDHSHVAFVFDPTEANKREVVDGELAEMLASLYLDLKGGLILYERSSDDERAQALWDWRFGATQGWGAKFACAFLPLHSLLQHHYDAIGEEWWANYENETARS